MSVSRFIEYEAVLRRPEHAIASGLSVDEIEGALDDIAKFDDHMILELAAILVLRC